MHIFTINDPDVGMRRFAHFDLPTHPVCWLRGHRARAEVIDPESRGIDPWVLIECRTCAVRHQNPYLSAGIDSKLGREEAKQRIAEQVNAARNNNAAYAQVRDGRDGYDHRHVELALETSARYRYTAGFSVRIGDRWSETPLDAAVHLFGRSAYFSIGGIGNRLAHRLTKGKKASIHVGGKFVEQPKAAAR